MKIMSRPRQGGKTYETVQWVKKDSNKRAMVVFSQERKAYLMEKYELTDHQIIVPASFKENVFRTVRIDDLEMVLDRMGFPYVDGFTIRPVELI